MESFEETEMTVTQLGTRVDRLDSEVESMKNQLGEVKTTVAGSAAMVEGLRNDMSVLFSKMDRWSESYSGASATKGMIPASYVTWGVGLMVSLAGLGLTVTGTAAAVILWAQSSGDDKVELIVESNREEMVENEQELAYIREWRDQFLTEWGRAQEKLHWTRHEIDDHEDEADHPLKQTEGINALKDDLNWLKEQIERIDSEGSRKWNRPPTAE